MEALLEYSIEKGGIHGDYLHTNSLNDHSVHFIRAELEFVA